eukprot:GHVT01025409.1.p2 GENE.GHVT01025409.1~~GHVT01025409.1.p2  ORF type:complete len:530 (-),score=33.06 GHVT01025409.1:4698-6110(-)
MNEYHYMYSKLRKDFGKQCKFEHTDPKILGYIEPQPSLREAFVQKNPRTLVIDNIPELSEHSISTERVSVTSRGVRHTEGGWPKEVASSEHQETSKWRKRLDKDPAFVAAVKQLTTEASKQIAENNTLDLFEEYFVGEEVQYKCETLSAKTLMLFKDPIESPQRTATKISWHPDGPTRLAVGYGIMRFQQQPAAMPSMALIWDTSNPNVPVNELASTTPVISLQYNTKGTDIIVGGCYDGTIALWDLRKGSQPVDTSQIENSHYDPIYDITWLQSKTNNECVSVSTDGRLLWWDTRNLSEPMDVCELTDGTAPKIDGQSLVGGVALGWAMEAGPTKFLVGTEQGSILALNKKPQKAVDVVLRYGMESNGHHGPVYSIKRNPTHPKFFLTVGDWSAKIWMEELKTPIMTTPYHSSQLTYGQWSPTRTGVFMVCRKDGYIDFWDIFNSQNEVALKHKVKNAIWHRSILSRIT